jgi:hypothetical protein
VVFPCIKIGVSNGSNITPRRFFLAVPKARNSVAFTLNHAYSAHCYCCCWWWVVVSSKVVGLYYKEKKEA